MESERLTVVIPTFDRLVATNRAIASIVTIQPDLVDVIIVDDNGSKIYELPIRTRTDTIRIQVIRNRLNVGAGLSRLVGVTASSTNYIAFLDSDDVFSNTWIDSVLEAIKNHHTKTDEPAIIIGRVHGGKSFHKAIEQLIYSLPIKFVPLCVRLLTVFFNPFYTSSVVIPRRSCCFHGSLRYCEDYYTVMCAVFQVNKIVLLDTVATQLSRNPGTQGGLSSNQLQMFIGETVVRLSMLQEKNVPILYKLFIPLGVLWQIIREIAKLSIYLLHKVSKR